MPFRRRQELKISSCMGMAKSMRPANKPLRWAASLAGASRLKSTSAKAGKNENPERIRIRNRHRLTLGR